jgi:hypothetical protein
MPADLEDRLGSPRGSGGRAPRFGAPVRLTGLALAVAGLCALVPATAAAGQPDKRPGMRFEHSAESGVLSGGRLVLRGVHHQVPWDDGRRSGVLPVSQLHERLFLPGKPLSGALDIARGSGGAPRLRLSRPRYKAAGRTVSYRVERLDKRPLPRRFGTAALSMVGRAQTQTCEAQVYYNDGEPFGLSVSSYSDWSTDTWETTPWQGHQFRGDEGENWASYGGVLEGCGNTVNLELIPGENGWGGDVSISVSFDWQGNLKTNSCTVSNNPNPVYCVQQAGVSPITYWVYSDRHPYPPRS